MKKILLALCLCLPWLWFGCAELPGPEDPVDDEAAALLEGAVDPVPPPPVPEPEPTPLPDPPPGPRPPPISACSSTCVQQYQECAAHVTGPLDTCMCQTARWQCLKDCGVGSPMPRCWAW